MKLSKIDEYASQIPIEIKKAVRAFGHDIRCAIVVDLTRKGELTFTQLKENLDIDTGLLNNHLKILMDSAIVEHYYKHELGNEQYSYYGLTLFGKDFLRGILKPLRSVQQLGKLPAMPTSGMPFVHAYKRRPRLGIGGFATPPVLQRSFGTRIPKHSGRI
jgi:hypothetical protein